MVADAGLLLVGLVLYSTFLVVVYAAGLGLVALFKTRIYTLRLHLIVLFYRMLTISLCSQHRLVACFRVLVLVF